MLLEAMQQLPRRPQDGLANACCVLVSFALLVLLVAGAEGERNTIVEGPATRIELAEVVGCDKLVYMHFCASTFAAVPYGAGFPVLQLGNNESHVTWRSLDDDLCWGNAVDALSKWEFGVCMRREAPWYLVLFLVMLLLFASVLFCACFTVFLI